MVKHLQTVKQKIGDIMKNRFDYIAFDEIAKARQLHIKKQFEELAAEIGEFGISRPVSLAMTALEEAYMWVGKANRDEQIKRNNLSQLQEGRGDS
jgi:hypothetical protein